MSPIINLIIFVAAFSGLVAEVQAAPSPVLSFSPLIYSSSNAGQLVDASTFAISAHGGNSYSQTIGPQTGFHSITASGADNSVRIDIYQDSTTTTETHSISYYKDMAFYSILAKPNNYAGGKWIEMKGRILALSDANFGYELLASGHYQTNEVPGIGNVVPALPSLFVSFGQNVIQNINTVSWTNPGSSDSYSVQSNASPLTSLSRGMAMPFSASLYAEDNITFDTFKLNIIGAMYDYKDTTTMSTTAHSNLVTSIDIPAFSVSPVPEPAAFPMMAIGILIVWRAVRRKRNAKFKI